MGRNKFVAAHAAKAALEESNGSEWDESSESDSTEEPAAPAPAPTPAPSPAPAKPAITRANVADRYRLGKVLGEGSFATVREAWNNDSGLRVAIKILRKADNQKLLQKEEKEVGIMMKVRRCACHLLLSSLESSESAPTPPLNSAPTPPLNSFYFFPVVC